MLVDFGAHAGFNEAPACLPGKTGLDVAILDAAGDLASMRPRRVCRGKRAVGR